MKNFVQPGRIVPVTAPADVASGELVFVGALFGVACATALSGASVEIETEGVFTLPKVSAQAWTQGAAIYWDAGDKVATTDDDEGGNAFIGHATAAANNPSATGAVRLSI